MMSEATVTILGAVIIAFFGAAAVLYFRLGSMSSRLESLKEEIEKLFVKWDSRPCTTHGEKMTELTVREDNLCQRVARLENRSDITDNKLSAASYRSDKEDTRADKGDVRTGIVEVRTGKLETRADKSESRADAAEKREK